MYGAGPVLRDYVGTGIMREHVNLERKMITTVESTRITIESLIFWMEGYSTINL